MRISNLLLVLCCAAPAWCDESSEFRVWTDAAGKFKVTAKMESLHSGTVTLLSINGKTVNVPLEKLSEDDQAWVASASKSVRDKKLADKRQEHQSWIVRVTGERPVVKDNPSTVVYIGGRAPTVKHNLYQTTEKFTTTQSFQGELIAYNGADVTISVCVYVDEQKRENYVAGKLAHKINKTFNYNNLGKNDQKFLTDYRKIERGE